MTHNPHAGVHPLKDRSLHLNKFIKFKPTFHLISLNGFNNELYDYVGMFFRLLSKEVPHKDPLKYHNIKVETNYETSIYDELIAVGQTYTLKGHNTVVQTHVYNNMLCRRFTKQLLADIHPNSFIIFVVSATDLIRRLRCWSLLDYWNHYIRSYTANYIDNYHYRTTYNCIDMFNYVYNFHKNMSKLSDFNEHYPFRNRVLITLTNVEKYNNNIQLELVQDMNLNTKCLNRIRRLEGRSNPCGVSYDPYPKYSIDSWWAINDLLRYAHLVPQRSFRTVDDDDYNT